MRTGILGGTFDPIHIAHLHAAQTAMHQAGLDRVLIMPAGDPWQKGERAVTPARQRLKMASLAVEGVPGLEVDDREIERGGPTYTIDTLATFPDDEELHLVLGADAALGIPSWERSDEVRAKSTLLVAPRAGIDATAVAELLPEAVFLDMAVLEISATEIREMARSGDPFRFLVPGTVYDYITARHLYAEYLPGDRVGVSTDAEEVP